MPPVVAAVVAAPLITAAVVGTTAVVAGTILEARRGKKLAHEGRQAQAAKTVAEETARTALASERAVARAEQKKQSDVANLRARRGAARRSVAARSAAIAKGATEGGVVTTAAAGTAGAAITEGAVNMSFLDIMAASQSRELASNVRTEGIYDTLNRTLNAIPQPFDRGPSALETGLSVAGTAASGYLSYAG